MYLFVFLFAAQCSPACSVEWPLRASFFCQNQLSAGQAKDYSMRAVRANQNGKVWLNNGLKLCKTLLKNTHDDSFAH